MPRGLSYKLLSHPLIVNITLFVKINNFLKFNINYIMTFSISHWGAWDDSFCVTGKVLLNMQVTSVMWLQVTSVTGLPSGPSPCWSSSSKICSAYWNKFFRSMHFLLHTKLKRLQHLSLSALKCTFNRPSYNGTYFISLSLLIEREICQASRVWFSYSNIQITCYKVWRPHFVSAVNDVVATSAMADELMLKNRKVRKDKVQGAVV